MNSDSQSSYGDDPLPESHGLAASTWTGLRESPWQSKRRPDECAESLTSKEKKEFELKEREIELKRFEVEQKIQAEQNRSIWKTTPGVGVIGTLVTLMTAVCSNLIQGCESSRVRQNEIQNKQQEHEDQLELDRKRFQTDLIQKAIERSDDTEQAAANLSFLWEAGLINDYPKVEDLIKEENRVNLPTGQSFGVTIDQDKNYAIDGRVRITNTSDYPYRAICAIIARKNGKESLATGFFVSPRLLLTAGHFLFNNPNLAPGWVDEVTVLAGANGTPNAEYGSFIVEKSNLVVSRAWHERSDQFLDYGGIMLTENLGGSVGTFALKSFSASEIREMSISIFGYPVDKPYLTLWGDSGRINDVRLQSIRYRLFTGAGMAGAPVIYVPDGSDSNDPVFAIGIHNRSFPTSKSATRFTESTLQNIKAWIELSESASKEGTE